MSSKRDLVMTISLSALEHLGINLYSNVPAVLSEIVANAWDADAETVTITMDKADGRIVIHDNGVGMDRDAVIDRFLTVGFKRRLSLGSKTPKLGRDPMGRKGIGKLSIFSIAQIAEVHTMADGERTSFRMDRDAIKAAIEGTGNDVYEPEELEGWPATMSKGTMIILSGLTKKISGMTGEGLRRRVARRFSIIGPENKFEVVVDGHPIGTEDRGYHKMVEFLWTYGDVADFVSSATNVARSAEDRTQEVVATLMEKGLTLTGWIGTVTKPSQLKDEDGDNLNRLAIFMRGKMAQEDILDDFAQKEIYADYVIGELHCDALDEDDKGDIATSSRQSLKQDDPRFERLREVVLAELRHIASKWSDWRTADGAKIALQVPAVSDWLEALEGDTKKKAQKWIGRLNTVRPQDGNDTKELLKASILAFESFRRRQELDSLDKIENQGLTEILKIFNNVDELETSYYGQIVRLRVDVIRSLQEKLKADEKELVLRDYIFQHLWLLDPGWERVKGTEHAETIVNNFLDNNTTNLSAKQKAARIDIGYRTTSGKHVIIELKRASVSVPVDDLTKQVRKYRDGAKKLLAKTKHKDWPLEIICLLGKPPPEWNDAEGTGKKGVEDALKAVDARILFYDSMLDHAQQAYADYLEEHVKTDKLYHVFAAIDDFAPPAP